MRSAKNDQNTWTWLFGDVIIHDTEGKQVKMLNFLNVIRLKFLRALRTFYVVSISFFIALCSSLFPPVFSGQFCRSPSFALWWDLIYSAFDVHFRRGWLTECPETTDETRRDSFFTFPFFSLFEFFLSFPQMCFKEHKSDFRRLRLYSSFISRFRFSRWITFG